jgi:Rrf2 family protein
MSMRMSQGVEWSIHACHLLAELPPDGSLSASDLAEFFDLPTPYLRKHLQALSRAGITAAAPGPRGGYRLARAAHEVTLLDVVEAIDGSAPAFRCTEIRQRGLAAVPPRLCGRACAIASAMATAGEAWRRELASVTIADISSSFASEAPAIAARIQASVRDIATHPADSSGT